MHKKREPLYELGGRERACHICPLKISCNMSVLRAAGSINKGGGEGNQLLRAVVHSSINRNNGHYISSVTFALAYVS